MENPEYIQVVDIAQKGDINDYVKVAQEYFEYYNYYDGGIDGDFGNNTENGVRRWQQDMGLPVTGVIDADDWAVILKG